jgi:hypothetical protein
LGYKLGKGIVIAMLLQILKVLAILCTRDQQTESSIRNEKYKYEKLPEQKNQESWLQKITYTS